MVAFHHHHPRQQIRGVHHKLGEINHNCFILVSLLTLSADDVLQPYDLFSPADERMAVQARTFTRWINLVLQRVTHNSRLPHSSLADASELISHFVAPRAILQLPCMTCSKTFRMEES